MGRWWKRTLAGVAGLVVLGGGAVLYVISRDTATPIRVTEAVDRYREGTTTAPSSTPSAPEALGLPAAGVYVYATDGSERIDILGGATHDYPAETTVTIERTACGLRQRWTPLAERGDDEELCVTDDGLERRVLRTHHEFFAFGDDTTFTCEPGYLVVPADPEPGDSWTTDCTAGSTRLVGRGEVVELTVRRIAGVDVDTVHVRIEEESSGDDEGTSSDDYWFRRSDGLLVERASSVRTRSDSPVGTATYEESFTLRLTSLEPQT